MSKKCAFYLFVGLLLCFLNQQLIFSSEPSWFVGLTGTELQGENPPIFTSIDYTHGGSPQTILIPGTISPFGLSCAPDGRYAFAASSDGNVYQISTGPSPQVESTFAVGGSLFAIAVSPDGQYVYVTQSESYSLESIVRIDIKTGTPQRSYLLSEATNYLPTITLSPDGAYAYVVENGTSKVWQVNLTSGGTTFFEVGPVPQGLASTPDGSVLVVACVGTGDNGSVYAVPTATLVPQMISGIDPSAQPFAVAIAPKGNYAYITDINNQELIVVDIAQKSLDRLIDLKPHGGFPYGISITPDGLFAYIANSSGEGNRVLLVALTAPYEVSVVSLDQERYYDSVVITPDQAPTALFTTSLGHVGKESSFNAHSSTSPVGTIEKYVWDFGDGSTLTTASDNVKHVYATGGTYTVTLTVTNTAGTSLEKSFTGQHVSTNGGPSARMTKEIQIRFSKVHKPRKFVGKIHNRTEKHKFFLYTKWKRSHTSDIARYELYDRHTLVASIPSASKLRENIHFHASFHKKSDMSHEFLRSLHNRYRIRAVTSFGQESSFSHVTLKNT